MNFIVLVICITIIIVVKIVTQHKSNARVIKRIDIKQHIKDPLLNKYDNYELEIMSNGQCRLNCYDHEPKPLY